MNWTRIYEKVDEEVESNLLSLSPKENIVEDTTTDQELLCIVQQLGINQASFHLIGDIQNIVQNFTYKSSHVWNFREVSSEKYWINSVSQAVVSQYPFLSTLKQEVDFLIRKEKTNGDDSDQDESIHTEFQTSEMKNNLPLSNLIEDVESKEDNSDISEAEAVSTKVLEPGVQYSRTSLDNFYTKFHEREKYMLTGRQILSKIGLKDKDHLLAFINEERDKIGNMFMHNQAVQHQKNRNDENPPLKEVKYHLDRMRKVIKKDLSNNEILDILFYWPFEFPDQMRKASFHHMGTDGIESQTTMKWSPTKLKTIKSKRISKDIDGFQGAANENRRSSRESLGSVSDFDSKQELDSSSSVDDFDLENNNNIKNYRQTGKNGLINISDIRIELFDGLDSLSQNQKYQDNYMSDAQNKGKLRTQRTGNVENIIATSNSKMKNFASKMKTGKKDFEHSTQRRMSMMTSSNSKLEINSKLSQKDSNFNVRRQSW